MRDLERALDGLAPSPGELPPSMAAGLQAVRTRRRIVRTGAALAAMVALASMASIVVVSLRPTPRPLLAGRDAVELPDSPFALVVLTRYNRDLDPDRLVLPEAGPGAEGRPLRPGDARTYTP